MGFMRAAQASSPSLDTGLIHTQLDHNEWAIRKLIDAARTLSHEEFTRAHDIGPRPGSLQALISHLIAGMRFIADAARGIEYRLPDDFESLSLHPDGLSALLADADSAVRSALDDYAENRDGAAIVWQADGTVLDLAAAVTQLVVHGAHHRAQCIYILDRLGRETPHLWPITLAAERDAKA
jgi:uncharacterized damage-inducible protein DinB